MGHLRLNQFNNYNQKTVNILLDEIISNSLNDGNLHFFITINFEKNIKKNEDLVLKLVHLNELLTKNIQLISWYQICWELNSNENYHLHLIIAVRSIIGYNNVITNNIQYFLRNNYELDTQVKFCKDFINIKKSWCYILKEYKKNNNSKIYIIERYNEIFNSIKIVFKIIKFNTQWDWILGKIAINNKYDINIILSLWSYYFIINDLSIFNNKIYKKINKSMISYKEINNLESIYDDFKNIYTFFLSIFEIHFKNFDIVNFIGSNLINKEDKIKRFIDYTTNKINLNYNVMEFTDGVYFILYNQFFRKDKFSQQHNISLEKCLQKKNIQTSKYYNCSFSNLNEPKKWLEGLEKVLGFKEIKTTGDKILNLFQGNEDAKWLLIYIAYIFHYSTNELNKKSTLYIWGASNTGKTTMVINPLINYFGKENIALFSNNKNFEYQNIQNKKLLILDEFDFSKTNIDNFKKILSGELILGEKKNKDPHIIEHLPIIISSNQNPDFGLNMIENKQAILNRIKSINFKNKIKDLEQELDIKKELLKEEAKIILYCNRVYFNYIKKEKNIKIKKLKLIT